MPEMQNKLEIPTEWTTVEQWVWARITADAPADLVAYDVDQKPPQHDRQTGRTEDHRLSTKFLKTILTQKDFIDATPSGGVRILNATIDDAPLTLEHAHLPHQFRLEKSFILHEVKCPNLRVDGDLSFEKSLAAGNLVLSGTDIREGLVLTDLTVHGELDLDTAKIGNNLDMRGSRFEGKVNLNSSSIGGHAFLRNDAKFLSELDLGGAKIGATLDMSGSRFEGKVSLNSSNVASHAFLRHDAMFKSELDLIGAKIGMDLDMTGSRFEGKLSLNSSRIGRHAFLHNDTKFLSELDLVGAEIGATLDMSGSRFEGKVSLNSSRIGRHAFLHNDAKFLSELDLAGAEIGATLDMSGSRYHGKVSLNSSNIASHAFLRNGAIFKSELDLIGAKIGMDLDINSSWFENTIKMETADIGIDLNLSGSKFEKNINLSSCIVTGNAFFNAGATFKETVDLAFTKFGSLLDMSGSSFEGDVELGAATIGSDMNMGDSTFAGSVNLSGISVGGDSFLNKHASFQSDLTLTGGNFGSNLEMDSATFNRDVSLNRASIEGSAFLNSGALFKGRVDLRFANITSTLEMSGATFSGLVDLTGCKVVDDLRLALSATNSAHWEDSASLTLRNTHVGVLQDWWQSKDANAWPSSYQLEGFTYNRLGSTSEAFASDMMDRQVKSYIDWLNKDRGSSTQPYEHLARLFREAGEPYKSADLLYAARERQRRKAWSNVDDYDKPKNREYLRVLGLQALRLTIGYGLGYRYVYLLVWIIVFTLLGAFVLTGLSTPSSLDWLQACFASVDQLLPIITLDKAHDVLIFGDLTANPPIDAQSYGVRIYFYVQKIVGWVLGTFLVAALAGLTQKN
jgi:hypothetical protein